MKRSYVTLAVAATLLLSALPGCLDDTAPGTGTNDPNPTVPAVKSAGLRADGAIVIVRRAR